VQFFEQKTLDLEPEHHTKTRKHPANERSAFSINNSIQLKNYGFFVAFGAGALAAGVLAGFIAELAAGALAAGLFALAGALPAGVFVAGVVTGLATTAGVFAGAAFAGLLALFAGALLAASPHAIPSALNPRTVESTITFVILFKTPIYTQRIKYLLPGTGRS
jgi:hypothetical protein